MRFWGRLLRCFGWEVDITARLYDKCVICVAPHTSNLDFIIGLLAYRSMGRKSNFLMKKFWFFFPLKYILRSLGGIPVERSEKGANLTQQIIEKFENTNYMNLAVTPEGTRSARKKWKTGFLYIAYGAQVPVLLGVIDYHGKKVIIRDRLDISGNIETDMARVKEYYSNYKTAAKYPDKFTF